MYCFQGKQLSYYDISEFAITLCGILLSILQFDRMHSGCADIRINSQQKVASVNGLRRLASRQYRFSLCMVNERNDLFRDWGRLMYNDRIAYNLGFTQKNFKVCSPV